MRPTIDELLPLATAGCLGALACGLTGRALRLRQQLVAVLYTWHSILCLTAYRYIQINGGDALDYYGAAASGSTPPLGLGTPMVIWITKGIIGALGADLLSTFFVFNIAGSIGLLLLTDCLDRLVDGQRKLYWLISRLFIFMPSASFWSSAIGKDALSFLAICAIVWGKTSDIAGRCITYGGVILMALVRPHVATMLLFALLISSGTGANQALYRRALSTIALPIAAALVLPAALAYVGLSEASSVADVQRYVETRQAYNLEGDGAVDISGMLLPLKVFTYVYRPHLLEAHSIAAILAAFEGLFLMLVTSAATVSFLRRTPRSKSAGSLSREHKISRLFFLVYVLVTTTTLASTTSNLGIALRQKWMVLPPLVYLLIARLCDCSMSVKSSAADDLDLVPWSSSSSISRRPTPSLTLVAENR